MTDKGSTFLVVDDDDAFRNRLVRALGDRGFEARGARDHGEALALAAIETPEYAIVDLKMPGLSGLDVVRDLHALDPSTRIVVLTGYGSVVTAVDAMKAGAFHYVMKPIALDSLLAAAFGERIAQSAATTPSLARIEWEHIQRVLNDCDGNVSQAAKVLGLHRRSLQRKLGKDPLAR